MVIDNIFELSKKLDEYFLKNVKTFMSSDKSSILIMFLNGSDYDKILNIKWVKSGEVIIYFGENYSDEVYKDLYFSVLNFLRELNLKIQVRNHTRKFRNLFRKIIGGKDVDILKGEGLPRCPESESGFYTILRKPDNISLNDYYMVGALVYFNGDLVGVLKLIGQKHLLFFTSNYCEKYMFADFAESLSNKINLGFKSMKFKKYWFRVNLVGNKFPIIFNSKNMSKFLRDFSLLGGEYSFPEVSNKSRMDIYRQFILRISECYDENKNVKKFDLTLNV